MYDKYNGLFQKEETSWCCLITDFLKVNNTDVLFEILPTPMGVPDPVSTQSNQVTFPLNDIIRYFQRSCLQYYISAPTSQRADVDIQEDMSTIIWYSGLAKQYGGQFSFVYSVWKVQKHKKNNIFYSLISLPFYPKILGIWRRKN
jgi:hypothetical protein